MAVQIWNDGVELELEKVGSYRTVRSTEEAAECLLYRWPVHDGKAWLAAQRACLAALDGKSTADKARQAFLKAADEADIFVRSRTDPRKAAMASPARGRNKMTFSSSAAWRKANKAATEAVEKSVTKLMRERERHGKGEGD